MLAHLGGTDAFLPAGLNAKGVEFEMDSLLLPSLSGTSTQIPPFIQYLWLKNFDRILSVASGGLSLTSQYVK